MKIKMPYISFPKFFLYFTLIFCSYLLIGLFLGLPDAEENSHIDYISGTKESKKDISKQIDVIGNKLKANDYGDEHGGHWGDLLAHSFYGYSLVSIHLQDKQNIQFRDFTEKELESIYEYTINDGKYNFRNQVTKIPFGIIYQGHKNQVLASLVIVGAEKYRKELYKNNDWLASELEKSREYNGESYKNLGWYVDNINAFYSLYLTDKIREKNGEQKKHETLIKNWVREMKKNTDNKGNILAEAYSVGTGLNQSRGCAQSWVLSYLYEIDKGLFDEQYELFNKHFYDERMGLGLVTDVPKGDTLENLFPAGPSLFGYSSSATSLTLPLYKLTKDKDKFQKTLKTLEFLLSYDLEKGDYTSWQSTLLSSLLLWGKTHTTWGDKI